MPSLIKDAIAGYVEGKRLVAPLMGFPGLTITNQTIKAAQEDHRLHFAAIKALADEFHPDLIFPFMDLSLEAGALGMPLKIPEDEPASVVAQTYNAARLDKISRTEILKNKRIREYLHTLEHMVGGLKPEIIKGAYVTGPFTLTALIMEAEEAAIAVMNDPGSLHDLLEICTRKIMNFIKLVYETGIELVCLLEPTAVLLSPCQFSEFSSKYTSRIEDFCSFQDIECILHICGNTTHLIDNILESGIKVLSLDSKETGVDLPAIAEKVPSDVLLLGNINPTGSILNGTPTAVDEETLELLNRMERFPNFVLSTGCDLPKNTPLNNIRAFMQAARSYGIVHPE